MAQISSCRSLFSDARLAGLGELGLEVEAEGTQAFEAQDVRGGVLPERAHLQVLDGHRQLPERWRLLGEVVDLEPLQPRKAAEVGVVPRGGEAQPLDLSERLEGAQILSVPAGELDVGEHWMALRQLVDLLEELGVQAVNVDPHRTIDVLQRGHSVGRFRGEPDDAPALAQDARAGHLELFLHHTWRQVGVQLLIEEPVPRGLPALGQTQRRRRLGRRFGRALDDQRGARCRQRSATEQRSATKQRSTGQPRHRPEQECTVHV